MRETPKEAKLEDGDFVRYKTTGEKFRLEGKFFRLWKLRREDYVFLIADDELELLPWSRGVVWKNLCR